MVSQSQLVYTRSGANLALGPIGSSTVAGSIVPYYNTYFADTWHIKPSVTISYGLSYQLEMPPHEANGKQVDAGLSGRLPGGHGGLHGAAPESGAGRFGVQPDPGLLHRQQCRGRPQVPVRSVLRRLRPALLDRLESQVQRWHPGQTARQQRHRVARRVWPPLRPPERRDSGTDAAAGARPAAGGLLHRRQPHGTVPGQQRRRSEHGLPHRTGRDVRSAASRLADA